MDAKNDFKKPKINNNRTNFLLNDDLNSSLEGKPRNRKTTENLIDQIRGMTSQFNTMFKSTVRNFLNFGRQLTSMTSQFSPLASLGGKMRDNIFNSKRFYYYYHIINSILNPRYPHHAYDVKQGRFVFFSEGDGFVNIERLVQFLLPL